MPKKKKAKTNKNNPNPLPSGGDPLTNAEETAQFLSVANSLLQHNDASFDALRTEVTQLRTQNLLQKQQQHIDIDELKGGKEHLQHHLDIANETTKTLQETVRRLGLEQTNHVQRTTEAREQMKERQANETKELRLELERLQRENQTLSEYRDKKDEHDKKIEALEDELTATKAKYEERLRAKDVDLQEQTEHLIQRLNSEVKRTKEEMNKKMVDELASTTKHTMEENSRLITELQFQSHRIHKLGKCGDGGKRHGCASLRVWFTDVVLLVLLVLLPMCVSLCCARSSWKYKNEFKKQIVEKGRVQPRRHAIDQCKTNSILHEIVYSDAKRGRGKEKRNLFARRRTNERGKSKKSGRERCRCWSVV